MLNAEKFSDVVVMELVDHPLAIAVTRNESQVSQQPKLVRDGRRLPPQSVRKLANRQRRLNSLGYEGIFRHRSL